MKAKTTLIAILFACTAMLFSSCSSSPQLYGGTISNHETTDIKEILTRPGDYAGKTVTIKGTIVRECPTGCWLDVGTENAALHVDINPAGLAIPQEVGSEVTVEGVIQHSDNQVSMHGQGLEIK
jgi:hypothetical protein